MPVPRKIIGVISSNLITEPNFHLTFSGHRKEINVAPKEVIVILSLSEA